MGKYNITAIKGEEVINNRGLPTIRAKVWVNGELMGQADAPTGSSKGSYEARYLYDGETAFGGKGVKNVIKKVEEIILPEIKGMEVIDQRSIDKKIIELDGTDDKHNLGGNTIVAVSLAVVRAASNILKIPLYKYLNQNSHILPIPQATLINGGIHAGNELAFQEFCAMPVGALTFEECVEMISNLNICLKDLLTKKYGKQSICIGDDGAFAPPIREAKEALDLLQEIIETTLYKEKVFISIDVASTYFYDQKKRKYSFEKNEFSTENMIDYFKNLIKEYPFIISLEDPLYEDDFLGTSKMTKEMENIYIAGDDLFVTNIERFKKGITLESANSIIWKPDQIGTLTEALDIADYAGRNKYTVIVSGRSGNTGDDILPEISVAINARIMKTGGVSRNRNYNKLMEIEKHLGQTAIYAGKYFTK